MTGRWSSRSAHLEELLEEAFELDGDARSRFLEAVEADLRDDLIKLLEADAIPSPVDSHCAGLVEAAAAISGHGDACNTISAGQQTGAYRLLHLLGEGGMASVWLAERTDGRLSHQVAVKCLKTGLATPETRARFVLEQQIMAQLRHPYIARLYDVGVSSDNVPFIVMEWIDGVSLTRYCDEQRLGLTQRLELFRKVCSAVAHAHQNLVVHRDLKPANILVGRDGEPRLLDFGIAKLLDDTAPVTRTGMHMLTPEYAAPEQFSRGMITTATDGYMLGAVLYELLCGLRPRIFLRPGIPEDAAITAPSEALRRATRTITTSDDPRHPMQLAAHRASVPDRLCKALRGDLDTIVLKALQAEPERRYPTVEAFSEDIQRYLRQQPIAARKEAGSYRLGKFLQRHVLGVAIGTLVLIALVTATAVSMYQAGRAQTEAKRALATREFLTDLLEVSDAGMPRDQMPTTQTLLQDGAKRIRGEFADAPDVKVDLLLMLGRIQLHLGQYPSAEPLIKEALDIANARFAPESALWLQAHTEWASVLREQSHLAQSSQLLSAAIAAHRQAGGGDSDAMAQALIELSVIDGRAEHFDPAIASARQALDISRHLHGERRPEVQQALENLGTLLRQAGQLDEAETVARANVALSGTLYGRQKAKYAGSLDLLAYVLEDQNRDPEAEKLARQALAIDESVYDQPNAALMQTFAALDGSYYDQGKLDESNAILQRWLASQIQLKGANDPSLIPVLMNLALENEYRHQNLLAEGELHQALDIDAKQPGAIPPSMVADGWRSLVFALIPQHRLEEADADVKKAYEIDQHTFGNSGLRVGVDLTYQARVDMEMGRLQPALEQVDSALGNLGKPTAGEKPDIYDARLQKGAILNRLARYRDATALLMPLVAVLRTVGSEFEDHDRLSRALTELGRAQAGEGDTAAAVASWTEALALQQALQSPDPDQTAELRGWLEQARIAQARNAPQIPKKASRG